VSVQQPAKTRYFTILIDRNPRFVEPNDLSLFLDKYFGFGGSNRMGKERLALVGLSGSGKTELAVRFAEEHREDYDAIFLD
jgi:GTPase SAR1 family protein